MQRLISSKQMRSIERRAIDSGRKSEFDLMEAAGAGVAQEVSIWQARGKATREASVFCGPGNNGGDGYVVARKLSQMGWKVRVWADNPPQSDGPAHAMWKSWRKLGDVHSLSEFSARDCAPDRVVIDALFGLGISRHLEDPFRQALVTASRNSPIVAVDLLSGIHSDTGKSLTWEHCLTRPAELTVTFEYPKPGHFLDEGGELSGPVKVVPLGLGQEVDELELIDKMPCLAESDFLRHSKLHEKFSHCHKYDNGSVLVLAGGRGKGGAARLAARAALRIGAGVVTLGVLPETMGENAAQLNAIMLSVVRNLSTLDRTLREKQVSAVCVGPGFGTGKNQKELVKLVLRIGVPVVLDADALTMFRADPEELFDRTHERVVITPHLGEYRSLFYEHYRYLDMDPNYSKIDAAREASEQSRATVLLKGADTVIATPNGTVDVVSHFTSPETFWLATAGSGDVLAGFIAGLMARGYDLRKSACYAVLLHAAAAKALGPGLISEDLPEAVPALLRNLQSRVNSAHDDILGTNSATYS